MKVGILGSGNGVQQLHLIGQMQGMMFMYSILSSSQKYRSNEQKPRVYCEGQLEGFAKIKYAGFDIEKVVTDADLILAIGPAYSTEAFERHVSRT